MSEIEKFIETVKTLRDPEHGCPWDLEQTHASLRRYMLEESYECLEAIDGVNEAAIKDTNNNEQYKELKEELGDMLLQVLLHSQIASEAGQFNIEDVARLCNDKMRKRHPHVFDPNIAKAENIEDVHKNWDAAKAKEKSSRKSIFEGIPKEMPALARAWKISKKAVKESFEWDREDQLWQQLESELVEFKEALADITKHDQENNKAQEQNEKNLQRDKLQDALELELGDILFTLVNVARWYKLDPEDALRKVNNKFINRFNKMTQIAEAGQGKTLKDYSSTELEALWQEAKKALRASV